MFFLTQVPIVLFIGGTHDLLFGFNQTSEGFSTLLFLMVFVPLASLTWLVTEITLSVKHLRQQVKAQSFLMPVIALIFLVEALAIDLYILSFARM